MSATGDSKVTFSDSVKKGIHSTYNGHCATCLAHLPLRARQCAHLIASSDEGATVIRVGSDAGFINLDYRRSSPSNGFLLCPTCHIGYFTPPYITLAPPIEILAYIEKLLEQGGSKARIVYQICQDLQLYQDNPLGAPEDVKPLLPFMALYTLVTLKPDEVREDFLSTSYLPPFSTLDKESLRFIDAPPDSDPYGPNIYRIFDSASVTSTSPLSWGRIPLTDHFKEFRQRRLWRIPLRLEAVLAEFIARAGYGPRHPAGTPQHYARRIRILSEAHQEGLMGVGAPASGPVETQLPTSFAGGGGCDSDVRSPGFGTGQIGEAPGGGSGGGGGFGSRTTLLDRDGSGHVRSGGLGGGGWGSPNTRPAPYDCDGSAHAGGGVPDLLLARRERRRTVLDHDAIVQWAVNATQPIGPHYEDSYESVMDVDIVPSQYECDPSEHTVSSPVPHDSQEWEFGPHMSSNAISFARRGFLLY
ncbi:hypothetical protein BD410DRAFT_899338 [Rickenella mellea]|uniref:Uncharacterized protein n=1 Tax=Rickenella mellea TaxID=50990 RepID=A0A4Y7Q0U2_9AGAM|nr:hypothetical protein BD410DRAFT_899338 [Rickenella mellea]